MLPRLTGARLSVNVAMASELQKGENSSQDGKAARCSPLFNSWKSYRKITSRSPQRKHGV
jgi:hypothetical protein